MPCRTPSSSPRKRSTPTSRAAPSRSPSSAPSPGARSAADGGPCAACYDRRVQGETRNFSRGEFDKMIRAGIIGEDERLELVDGRIVAMSPEGAVHAGAIDLCAEALRRVFAIGHTVRVQHPLAIDPDDEPEPD